MKRAMTATSPHSHSEQERDTKTMSAEEARRTWRTLVDRVVAGEDVVVERYARPAVAVIAYEDYAAIRGELEEMRAARRALAVRAAWRQGKIKTLPWQEADLPGGEHAQETQPNALTAASERTDEPPRA